VNELLLALPTQGKDNVFRFSIEYNSLRDFGPQVIGPVSIQGFLKDDILTCVETCD
jgi:hypothetical protein